jgi:hypothetical protein
MGTYGNVLQLAEAKLGEKGCAFDQTEFLFALNHCMGIISNEVDWQWYNSTETITILDGVGTYKIPTGFTVEAIKNVNGICVADHSPAQACSPAPIITTPRYDVDCNVLVAVQVYPTSYTIQGNNIVFNQKFSLPAGTPSLTYTLVGSRAPGSSYYTDTTVGTTTTRTWLDVDLPPEYQAAFNLCVLGTLLIDKDPGQGSNYYALANDALKSARARKAKQRPKTMFSRKGTVGCCDIPTVRMRGVELIDSIYSDCC